MYNEEERNRAIAYWQNFIYPPSRRLEPLLKWAGGKRELVDEHFAPRWSGHEHRRLVEPFCGGMAVTLGLMPERALLNDISPHLMNLYMWVKRGFSISPTIRHGEVEYGQNKAYFNSLLKQGKDCSEETAAFFYYLMKTCWNGLCRFSKKTGFNVPIGRTSKKQGEKLLPWDEDFGFIHGFDMYRRAFAGWEFSCCDFEALKLEPDDFIYADPPYDKLSATANFTSYSATGFSWHDQQRLARWLSNHPGPVIASNHATPRIVELYRDHGFMLTTIKAARSISCKGDRTPADEILATKPVR